MAAKKTDEKCFGGVDAGEVLAAWKKTCTKDRPGGNKSEVAKVLGCSRGAVQRHLRAIGVKA